MTRPSGRLRGSSLTPQLDPSSVTRLFRKAGAARWRITESDFAEAVQASVGHAFRGGEPGSRELERYVDSLHVEDLALAAACALGRDAAWDHFVVEHRPVLYRAADALDPTGAARELADALYADLYGTRDDRGSLFRYYHGRSSLATWLRAVLAQRYVDSLRARKRLEPLPDDERMEPSRHAPPEDPDRATLVPVVERALRESVESLAPRDRLRLRSYYVSQLTLAEIGRITGEHEATVSRQLAKTRRTVREHMERFMREQAGLNGDQVDRAFELAVEDPGAMDLQQVLGAERKESTVERSK